MSSHDDQTDPGAPNYSTDTSPTDTRAPSRRFQPITQDDDDEESATESGTVRRNRPPAISTDTDYG